MDSPEGASPEAPEAELNRPLYMFFKSIVTNTTAVSYSDNSELNERNSELLELNSGPKP